MSDFIIVLCIIEEYDVPYQTTSAGATHDSFFKSHSIGGIVDVEGGERDV